MVRCGSGFLAEEWGQRSPGGCVVLVGGLSRHALKGSGLRGAAGLISPGSVGCPGHGRQQQERAAKMPFACMDTAWTRGQVRCGCIVPKCSVTRHSASATAHGVPFYVA